MREYNNLVSSMHVYKRKIQISYCALKWASLSSTSASSDRRDSNSTALNSTCKLKMKRVRLHSYLKDERRVSEVNCIYLFITIKTSDIP